MQTVVKKWFRDKNYGFLDNGQGPDIMVRKADLLNCQFLKVGVNVEFECHVDKRGLIARNVKLQKSAGAGGSSNSGGGGRPQNNRPQNNKPQGQQRPKGPQDKDNHGNSANHDGYGYSKPKPFGVMT